MRYVANDHAKAEGEMGLFFIQIVRQKELFDPPRYPLLPNRCMVGKTGALMVPSGNPYMPVVTIESALDEFGQKTCFPRGRRGDDQALQNLSPGRSGGGMVVGSKML